MKVVVGTSGFFYREWRGKFYPEDLPMSKWLSFYSQKFNGLEVNSTFYRLPKKESVRRFRREGGNLKFSFKLYRGITHYRRLSDDNVVPFLRVKEILGELLISLLAQFPATFKPDRENLEFVNLLVERFKGEGISVVVELRNGEWRGRLDEVGAPVVCSYFPKGLNWLTECKETEEIAYFRLHGKRLYGGSYTDGELRDLADRVRNSGSRVKAVFFNNTADGSAVFDALRLKELLGI